MQCKTRKNVFLDLGINDYMTKPLNRDLLFKKRFACNFDKTKNGDEDTLDENLRIA